MGAYYGFDIKLDLSFHYRPNTLDTPLKHKVKLWTDYVPQLITCAKSKWNDILKTL